MREQLTSKYLMALNSAYSMVKFGGYSAKLDTLEEPMDGYMIAITTIAKYPNISSVNVHEMVHPLYDFCKDFNTEDLYVGSWVDPDNGEVYFEVSLNIDDFEKAKNIGNIHDQRYIWDVANKTNIKL